MLGVLIVIVLVFKQLLSKILNLGYSAAHATALKILLEVADGNCISLIFHLH